MEKINFSLAKIELVKAIVYFACRNQDCSILQRDLFRVIAWEKSQSNINLLHDFILEELVSPHFSYLVSERGCA